MSEEPNLEIALRAWSKPLREEILRSSQLKEIPEGMEILREGQYVKVIPLVVKGLIKVFTRWVRMASSGVSVPALQVIISALEIRVVRI